MLRRALCAAVVVVCICLPPVATAGTTTVTFDDLTNPNRVLSGGYPTSVIDWGTNTWYLAGPWGQFTTNSVSFTSEAITSASFTFVNPQRLVQLDAFNGGTTDDRDQLDRHLHLSHTRQQQRVVHQLRQRRSRHWSVTRSASG